MMFSVEVLPFFWTVMRDRALSVHADDIGLGWKAVAHPGNIADVGGRRADRLDRNAVELRDGLGSRIGDIDVIFLQTDLGCARWKDQILSGNGIDDIQRGKTLSTAKPQCLGPLVPGAAFPRTDTAPLRPRP